MTVSSPQLVRSALLVVGLLLSTTTFLVAQDARKSTKDGKFTIEREIERLPVLSQDRTGTCWSFATVSFLESEMERIHKRPIDLSEMFPVYQAYIEKIRRYVRLGGKAQLSQGGLSHDVIHLVKRFGLTPASVYSGLCEGKERHEHDEMEKMLKAIADVIVTAKKPSKTWETGVRGVLDAYLTPPPTTFDFGGRQVTPRQYADEILKVPYNDYVEVMSFAYAPFWEEAELLVPDNWMRYGRYLNVPVDAMMEALDHALAQGYSVAVDIDVSEKGFQARRGVAKLPQKMEQSTVDDALRLRLFDSKDTTDDHLMHIVGTAKDEKGTTYYITKNSWGDKIGPYRGNLYMSRNYVALKMLAFMVHRDGLPRSFRDRVDM